MTNGIFDVLVAKEYETRTNGVAEKKTAWNKVGRAWPSKSGSSISLEFYMYPGQRYVVQVTNNEAKTNE